MQYPGAYPEIWIRGGREGVGSRLLPSPFRPLPSPFPPSLTPSRPSTPLPLEVGPLIQLGGLGPGERCKLPSGVWGGAKAEIEFATFYP